jgi:hypothetical protein
LTHYASPYGQSDRPRAGAAYDRRMAESLPRGRTRVTRHRGRWTSDDRLEAVYRYLPVEVPAGTYGIRVELDYDRAPRGADERSAPVVDLGCAGPDGFRGWSGGARDSFVVTADAATPGYLPGEPEPGTWHVVLGLYRIPAGGVDYTVTAHVTSATGASLFTPVVRSRFALESGAVPAVSGAAAQGGTGGAGAPRTAMVGPPVPAERPPRRALPAAPGHRWLAGDLHTHTVHSDGVLTVPELAAMAAGRGLDYLAITDHNTVSHHRELPGVSARYGITLVPGQEVTTEYGHANAFGDIGWIDFREPPDAWLDDTERRGGLLSINHPLAGDMSWIHPMRRRPPLAEIWHWTWLDPRYTHPLAWWLAWDPGLIPVGGSDWHLEGSDARPGTPTTWVECPVGGDAADPGAVLAGLRAGRVAITAERDGPVLLRADGGELVAVGAEGLTLAGPSGARRRVRGEVFRAGGSPGCHRLLDDAGATLALTP